MTKSLLLTALLAQIAHETNRAYCQSIGDTSQPSWDAAPDWQKESAMKGIEGALAGNTPEQQHQSWYAHKEADGWVYGEVKDPDAKRHPCMVPYAELPAEQQRKDHLYSAVVKAAFGALTDEQQAPERKVATRAKFTVTGVNPDQGTVNFHPVYSDDPNSENARFFAATPNGEITLRLVRTGVLANFTPGEAFYVDFTPAPK
ncbi:RyR domain-containing protein [Deinococcus oregonensis]|uniref:RyR domain-containing protein n=1 Tax=Deinococcus oregonensis TaxID=1805970 RepID=A0ABV6AUP7_9DEIO